MDTEKRLRQKWRLLKTTMDERGRRLWAGVEADAIGWGGVATVARALLRIAKAYPRAKRIHVVVDNLSTHTEKSRVDAFGARRGRALWRRLKIHYTTKHASWLNAAEMEASLVARQCLGKRRIADLSTLRREVRAWRRVATHEGSTIRWKFRVADARRAFKYDSLIFTRAAALVAVDHRVVGRSTRSSPRGHVASTCGAR